MRIGFDCSPLERPCPPGVVRVVRELLGALEARGRVEVVRLAPEPGEDLRAWRQRRLARAVTEEDLAGLHSFVSAFPLFGPGRRVQTLHELPWRHGARENADLAHRFWALVGPLRADAVLTPTEVVAADARAGLPGRRDRVRVCSWGVGAPFTGDAHTAEEDAALRASMGLAGAPYVLCPGAVRPKKRLSAVLAGAGRLLARTGEAPRVVVTGAGGAEHAAELAAARGLGDHVVATGELTDESLASLMRTASAVAVLSRSEGFGLPVLEAYASGTPVLVPPGSAQAEVAGELGIAVDAGDADSVAAGLARALDRGPGLASELRERARACSWERTARQVEELWEELS